MSNGGTYDPHSIEPRIYEFWEQGGHFHAEPDPNRKSYVIDIPLPNVTGSLHLGHALNNTLQDTLTRRARMLGYNAMWMPGTDHAGIATQAVVEKKLREDEGITRHEIGRDGLVERIWQWKEEYGGRILRQLRRIGASCDWQRTRFTLDEVCAKAVYEAFFRFFKDGLIYRGLRLVNWDAHLQTAVADDEIVHETVQGHLWHYRYPVLEGTNKPLVCSDEAVQAAVARATADNAKMGRDYLSIATTRPETMLGDTAIAVHPDDERYKHLIGQHVLLPRSEPGDSRYCRRIAGEARVWHRLREGHARTRSERLRLRTAQRARAESTSWPSTARSTRTEAGTRAWIATRRASRSSKTLRLLASWSRSSRTRMRSAIAIAARRRSNRCSASSGF